MSATVDSPRPRKRTVVLFCLVIMTMGVLVWYNYYLKMMKDQLQGHLPIRSRVETYPDNLVDQNGTPRNLNELKGKVIVWAYLYTTCPIGCAGLADEMKKLQDEFGKNPKFQLVSVSLFPEHDRPANLKGWIDTKGFGGDNWWFLTTKEGAEADGDGLRKWMQKTFGLWATKKSAEHIAKVPADVWDHLVVFTVSDAQGNIRQPTDTLTFWDPDHGAFGWYPRELRADVEKLLEEAN